MNHRNHCQVFVRQCLHLLVSTTKYTKHFVHGQVARHSWQMSRSLGQTSFTLIFRCLIAHVLWTTIHHRQHRPHLLTPNLNPPLHLYRSLNPSQGSHRQRCPSLSPSLIPHRRRHQRVVHPRPNPPPRLHPSLHPHHHHRHRHPSQIRHHRNQHRRRQHRRHPTLNLNLNQGILGLLCCQRMYSQNRRRRPALPTQIPSQYLSLRS